MDERETGETVKLQGVDVMKVDKFKYQGSTVKSIRQCTSKVRKRMQAGVICNSINKYK